jgi:aryl-alcohol dehydrogenase-like predicted oxidoreductase
MRLSTDQDRDEARATETIAAALQAGVTVFDTARAYARDAGELGHNERLLARAVRSCDAGDRARIVTKGGMTRAGGGWVPDGRAKAILGDCEGSLAALDGLPIDLYLLHAPDPRTPWRTSVRALARLAGSGAVRRVGVANVNRRQLDEALELAPIAAVQVALSRYDDRALRGGVLDRCAERGLTLIAHSPLGGPRRAGRLARDPAVAEVARAHGAPAAEVALAWLLALSPTVVAIPGARRPETARSASRAADLELDADDLAKLAPATARRQRRRPPATEAGDVVLLVGIPGAGKTRHAESLIAAGYLRLNRDERGGSLRQLAGDLDEALAAGTRHVVLDNTYLSRAARSDAIEVARGHAVPARCIWLDTPLAQAQVNLVLRLLERFGSLPTPEELRAVARREPGIMLPTSQMRALRELETPSTDEGFASVERVPFTRDASDGRRRRGVFVAAQALGRHGWRDALARADPLAPHLIFDWRPGGTPEDLTATLTSVAAEISGPVQGALCPHPGGPPRCWCRPPLPGLALAFARSHEITPASAIVIGTGPQHRTLATTLGALYMPV